MSWILDRLEKAGRKYVIYDKGEPYLTRYYLAYKDQVDGERTDIPGNIFLHHFHKSDSPVFHDHPFSYLTIILKGGYWEHKPDHEGFDRRVWRGPGSIIRSPKSKVKNLQLTTSNKPDGDGPTTQTAVIPTNAHWIELPEGIETWTLFFRGRKVNDELGRDDWGFYPDVFGPRVWWKDWLKIVRAKEM